MKWFIKDKNQWQKWQKEIFLCLIFLVFCFGLAIFTFGRLPAQVPLFYSLPWGEEQLAQKISLLLLPLGIFLVAFFNYLLIMTILKNHFLAVKILIWVTVSLIFLTSVDLIKIIFLIY